MPIRINLKELFGSDPQNITADKLNYNFNKLLELGVGLPGERGLTGIQGPAGPAGPTGPTGPGGNKWFVGSGNPNTQTFTGLIDGDFFLSSDNSEIWQYDEGTDSWTLLVDLEGVVTDYLTLAGVTFVRGVGDSSPDDERYIVFPNRGNDTTAVTTDAIGGSSENDILFLNNFNEKFSVVDIANFPANTNDLYTALEKIFVDDTSGVPGRYHLELGSLFADTQGPDTNLLSSLKHNIKLRHVVDDLGGSYQYPSSNEYLYIGKFSLSKTESQPTSELDFNSLFEFNTAKFNAEGASIVREEIAVRFGPTEALGEYHTGAIADGINIVSGSKVFEFGLASDFSSNNQDIDGNDYAIITQSGLDGIISIGDSFFDGGNIRQLGSTGGTTLGSLYISNSNQSNNAENIYGNLGIAAHGNTLYMVAGNSPVFDGTAQNLNSTGLTGTVSSWNTQEDLPELMHSEKNSASSFSPFSGVGLCDVEVSGRYLYLLNNQENSQLTESSGYNQANLQIMRHDLGLGNYSKLYNWPSYTSGLELDAAWRVKALGNHLIVGSNRLRYFGHPSNSNGGTITSTPRNTLHIVNVSDPASPFTTDQRALLNTHVLDMCVISNRWIAALEFQWTGVSAVFPSPPTATGYVVKLTVYEIRTDAATGLDIFTSAYSVTLDTYTTTVNNKTTFYNESISKVGTICTDGKYIYASYEDKTWVIEEDDTNSNPQILTSIIHTSGASYPKSYDSKVVGKSLYLISGGNAGSGVSDKQYTSTNTYLKKIDISDALSPVVEWSIETGHAGTKFEIVGNKAYIAHQFQYVTGNPNLGIETIELDGIITDHANIGSLKSTDIHSTGEINAARNVNVGRSISVGESALVQGTLGVEGIVDVGDSMRIGRGLNIGTSLNSSLDINNGKITLGTSGTTSRIDVNDNSSNDRINLVSTTSTAYINLNDGSGNRLVHINQSAGPYAVIALGANNPAFDGDGHYILAANPNQKLLFGSLVNPAGSNGINYELVLHNAGSSLPAPLGAKNGLQVSHSLWVGGDCHVNGTISGGSKLFKIKHPLPEKSETHYLEHSAVESPTIDNNYRGKSQLSQGQISINIDEFFGMTEGTFSALNRNIQCFTSNESGWSAVRGTVSDNILLIECQDSESNDTVSWLVVGERKDINIMESSNTDSDGRLIVEYARPEGDVDFDPSIYDMQIGEDSEEEGA